MSQEPKIQIRYLIIILLIIITLTGLFWVNYQYAQLNQGGNDFIPRWVGTRLFLLEGHSPYGEVVTHAIQDIIYGRDADASEDKSLFVYPAYSIFVFSPFALIGDYPLARALWMVFLELSLLGIGILSLSLCRWRPSPIMLAVMLVFILFWYHSVRPLINGNAAIVVALLITAAFYLIRADRDIPAGFLLALSTIKPQMVVLLLPYIVLWGISRKRWRLIISMVVSLSILITITSVLIPGWVFQNIDQIISYPNYTLPGTPGEIFGEWLPSAGKPIGWILTFILGLVILWEWRKLWTQDIDPFLWGAFLTLAITNLIGIRTAVSNYIALLPALILVWAEWRRRFTHMAHWLILLSMALMFFGLWWFFIVTLIPAEQPTQHPIMFLPLPILIILGLYSIRDRYLEQV